MKIAGFYLGISALIGLASAFAAGNESPTIDIESAANYPPRPYYESMGAEVSAIMAAADDGTVVVEFKTTSSYRVGANGEESDDHKSKPVLKWKLRDGPVPFFKGQPVILRTTLSDEVVVVRYCLDNVAAGRRGADGRWEFIVRAFGEKPLLRIAPTAFDRSFTEVRWTKTYGLIIASFPDGEYGGAETDELESATSRNKGWFIINYPNERVLPGRDGWVRFPGNLEGPVKGKDTDRWLAEDVLGSQRVR